MDSTTLSMIKQVYETMSVKKFYRNLKYENTYKAYKTEHLNVKYVYTSSR